MESVDPDIHDIVKRVYLRDTNINKFRSLRNCAVMEIGLAFSYFLRQPTFNPIPRYVIGSIFLVLGVGMLVSLILFRRLSLVDFFTGASLFVFITWGVLNTPQAFDNLASFTLPFLLWGMAGQIRPSLVDPFINPLTSNGNLEKKNGG